MPKAPPQKIRRILHVAIMGLVAMCCACTSVGQYRVPAATLDGDPPAIKGTVFLIIVEGLRQDTFDDHLTTLTRSDNEPNFRSGLALLAMDGFKFAASNRAEGPIGASPLTSGATLATAQSPGKHGIVGDHFIQRPPSGSEHQYDFSQALHTPGQWFTERFERPKLGRPTLLGTLTLEATWISQLAKVIPIGTAFHAYGLGSTWQIPQRRTVGSLALVNSATGALAVPMLDLASQKAATTLLLNGHRVVIAPFRQTRADSCHRSNASCDRANATLARQQALALRAIDESLWHIVTAYRAQKPTQYRNATVMVVGTHGIIDRARDMQPNTVHMITRNRLIDQIGAHLDDALCIKWFQDKATTDLRVVEEGAVARIYLPHCKPGQCAPNLARKCLARSMRKMTQTTQWLAGAMWLDNTDVDGRPRGLNYQVALRPAFSASIRAYRQDRLITKMRRAIDTTRTNRTGDAVLFASSRWAFGGSRGPVYAHEGGLADAAMNIPFFIASRALTDAAPSSIRTAPLELMDVGPTVYSVLGLKAPKALFERPPVVRWRDGSARILEFVKADRKISPPQVSDAPQIIWSEDESTISVGLREPRKHWPPDRVDIQLGATSHRWNPDTNAFPEGASCETKETKLFRQWQCRFPVDRGAPKRSQGRVTRTPDTDGMKPFTATQMFTTGYGVPTLHEASISCASDDFVRLRIHAEDTSGIARVDLYLARDKETQGTPRGNTSASTTLVPQNTCDDGDQRVGCAVYPRSLKPEVPVDVPLPSTALKQVRWSDRLLGRTRITRKQVQRNWKEAGQAGLPPRSDWLVVRVCNEAGHCAEQPIGSDALYTERLATGCSALSKVSTK